MCGRDYHANNQTRIKQYDKTISYAEIIFLTIFFVFNSILHFYIFSHIAQYYRSMAVT